MKEKMEDEDMPHGMDTTIYLVEKVARAPGSRSSKRTRWEETESVRAEEKLVGKVHADSHRLRECSKYFSTCMNERWARSNPALSQLEFHLELQADVVYYRDCFSRMEPGSFFQPIPSVDHCLELLKVASQIVFQEVVDLGIKYLSATPWSADDEVKIRRFYESGHIYLLSEAHADLTVRLRKSLTEKSRGEVLSLYLEHALTMWQKTGDRRVFEETFQINLSGPNRLAAIEFVKKEATILSSSFKTLADNIEDFAWLCGLLRSVHAAQSMVDFLLKERYIFESMFQYTTSETCGQVNHEAWIKLIGGMLQDVLDGRLFLTSLERNTLFRAWLQKCDMDDHDVRDLFTTFLMTFPFQKQKEMVDSLYYLEISEEVVLEVLKKWMCLVNDLASRRGQEVTAADLGEPSGSAE